MRIQHAVIVLADISGYTRFIKLHGLALVHAESVITELLESIIEHASYPLTLNKLQGDAVLFYALADENPKAYYAVERGGDIVRPRYFRTASTIGRVFITLALGALYVV